MATKYFYILAFLVISSLPGHRSQNPFESIFELTSNMYFNNTFRDVEHFLPEYDFVIVGSGSSGAVLANRLTEMADFSVLLLEAGRDENILTDIPLMATINQITSVNWGYKANKSPYSCLGLKNQVCNWPKGRVVGGTSVLNFMVFNRGHRDDYDGWRDNGNYGWGYEDVLEYFKKLEHVKPAYLKKSRFRGTSGPMSIEESSFQTPILDAFLKTGQSFGYPINDPNGEELLGFSKIQGTIKNGRRCSTAKAYLRPIIDRPNFHLSINSRVTKVLIDRATKTAFGVEFYKNKQKYRIKAKREVILSAGPIGSPQLLMLSGVGPKEHLDELQIKTLQDLRVGFNLQDHAALPGLSFTIEKPYSVRESDVRVNPLVLFDYLVNNSGPLTLPGGSEGYSFVKVPNSTLANNYPDIEIVMGPGGLHAMDTDSNEGLLGITKEFHVKTFGNIFNKHGFSLVPVLLKPKSRGRIMLKSRNPLHWPRMESGLFTQPEDVQVLTEGIRLCLKIAESPYFRKMGAKVNPNPFFGCEHENMFSDKYWECCIRRIGTTIQHQVGTCKMGPHWDSDAVVNPELQVYGIHNLRVVDTSIVPDIIAGHTNSVAIMIGEKAADMIKHFWVNQILNRK